MINHSCYSLKQRYYFSDARWLRKQPSPSYSFWAVMLYAYILRNRPTREKNVELKNGTLTWTSERTVTFHDELMVINTYLRITFIWNVVSVNLEELFSKHLSFNLQGLGSWDIFQLLFILILMHVNGALICKGLERFSRRETARFHPMLIKCWKYSLDNF